MDITQTGVEAFEAQIAMASALASLALTRSQRASKLVQAQELDAAALKDEVDALEELLQKITKVLA